MIGAQLPLTFQYSVACRPVYGSQVFGRWLMQAVGAAPVTMKPELQVLKVV